MGKGELVDIANSESDGSYPKCGRSGGEKKKKLSKNACPLQKQER